MVWGDAAGPVLRHPVSAWRSARSSGRRRIEGAFFDPLVRPSPSPSLSWSSCSGPGGFSPSMRHGRPRPSVVPRRSASGAVLALRLTVVVSHGWAGLGCDDVLRRGRPDLRPPRGRSVGPGGAGTGRRSHADTDVTPPTLTSRINVLLTGSTPGAAEHGPRHPDRRQRRPGDRDTAMISFPRDISRFPAWDGRPSRGRSTR